MRTRGKLIEWFDDKGYGFILTDDFDGKVFAHISSFPKSESRPKLNEILIFDLVQDAKKGAQAHSILYANRVRPMVKIKPTRVSTPEHKKGYKGLIVMIVIGFLVLNYLPSKSLISKPTQQEHLVTPNALVQETNQFKCTGKTKCSEMNSCEEAIFYLKNCAGTITDGDNDGLPCEDQWCGH